MSYMRNCLVLTLVGTVLFFVLSPGILLTLPPKCDGKTLAAMSDDENGCATSYSSVVVHSVVFALVVYGVCYFGLKRILN